MRIIGSFLVTDICFVVHPVMTLNLCQTYISSVPTGGGNFTLHLFQKAFHVEFLLFEESFILLSLFGLLLSLPILLLTLREFVNAGFLG